ncbi:multicopper oxidase family protein [Gloeothece verrucosa]|nr:multicopper oxidase domain-containing protein [Gloeothece verrucosa]
MIFSAQPAQAQEVPTSPNGQNSPGSTVEQKSNQFRIIRKIKNPPIAQTRRAKNYEKVYDLNIEYTQSQLFNPRTGKYDQVKLRSYTDANAKPSLAESSDQKKGIYVAPQVIVSPGDTVRMNLNNLLSQDYTCQDSIAKEKDVNNPHCFNGTNLHTHGLWISPVGNSDNVLVSINPGVKFQYEFNIPLDHPAGTFWYHPHRHGATALQVSSGMVGALIVKGDRLPSKNVNGKYTKGDIDVLLQEKQSDELGAPIGPMKENVLVLQQIQYACLDENGNIKVIKDSGGKILAWDCKSDDSDPKNNDTGVIEFYKDPTGNGLSKAASWQESKRFTSINGLIWPTFETEAGKIERWRLIHGGIRNTIRLKFFPAKSTLISEEPINNNTTNSPSINQYIQENCELDKPPIPFHVIANDGLTRSKARETNESILQGGYRIDALVVFPKAGSYCVVDDQTQASGSISQNPEQVQLLAKVKVDQPTTTSHDILSNLAKPTNSQESIIHRYLKKRLIESAKLAFRGEVKEVVIKNLKDELSLSPFIWYPDIEENEVTGHQELAFYIDTNNANKVLFEVSNGIRTRFNPQPYDPKRIDRQLELDGVDEWTLQSYFGSHPFHIHVNPFQIVKILDPTGKDVTAEGKLDNLERGKNNQQIIDPEYAGFKGVWKDTLWIKSLNSPTSPRGGAYTIVVRTRYKRYIGEFVLHCHILDHEDQGMMENVNIVMPNQVF